MIRTQVQLTEEQHRALRRWAHERGISLAEAVRRCVTEHLQRASPPDTWPDRVREARAVFGRHADPEGTSNVASEHDRYLEDGYSG